MQLAEGWPAPGDHLSVYRIDGVWCTTIICHDERYPELVRLPVLRGAQVVFYISHESDLHAEHNRLIVIMTSDRGLAGALNTNTVRFVAREITEHPGDLKVVPVGRKGRDAMRRARVPIAAYYEGFGERPTFADTLPIARLVAGDFVAGVLINKSLFINLLIKEKIVASDTFIMFDKYFLEA